MRPERHRTFGHPRLIELLKSIGAELARSKKPKLMIGDIGQARGGPTMSAHASHQTGLDVDVWFAGKAPTMVDKKKFKPLKAFGKAQVELLRRFAESPETDRILVNFVLKRQLCAEHGSEPWIRKIRPWFGHDHHFHVRLECSSGDAACKKGDPIPEGNGCDASLDWWFSDEARQKETENLGKQQNPVMPELPEACQALVKT
jgi:penicillin-insensitive murein endopeptidase